MKYVYQSNPTIEALWQELVESAWAATITEAAGWIVQSDQAIGMTLDDLLGDEVAELIRVNKL